MDIKRALIEDISGYTVVPGCLVITGGADLPSALMQQHDHLRLEDRVDGVYLSIVTNIERLDSGFCRVECQDLAICLSGLSARDIDGKVRSSFYGKPLGAASSFRKSEKHCATLSSLNAGFKRLRPQKFSQIEISWAYVATGLQLLVTGSDADGDAPFCEAFRIEVLLSWEIMTLLGWGAAGPHHRYDPEAPHGPSKTDSPRRPRDPKKLHDLMIQEGLSSPVIPGSFSLIPLDPSKPPVFREAKHPFVLLRKDYRENSITIAAILGVEVLDSGFVRTNSGSSSMVLDRFGWDWLEEGFKFKSSVSIAASGDMLGSVSYRTGGDEPWSPDAYTRQVINQMEILAVLNADGLALTAKGQLADVDCERRQALQKDGFAAKSAFHLSILMPWALIIVKQFSFARRISEF